jgi:hypothetical protein
MPKRSAELEEILRKLANRTKLSISPFPPGTRVKVNPLSYHRIGLSRFGVPAHIELPDARGVTVGPLWKQFLPVKWDGQETSIDVLAVHLMKD